MIKIVSWNVNSIRVRLPILEFLVNEEKPDIILLQETKVQSHQFPYEDILSLGYNSVCAGEKSYNGVAILSKYSIDDVCYSLHSEQEARYIDCFTAGIRVASVYIPNGRDVCDPHYKYKEVFFRKLKERLIYLKKFNEILIFGGDYNVAPTDRDVWNPKQWEGVVACTPSEREWLSQVQSTGMHDILCKNFDDTNVDFNVTLGERRNDFTWWDYRHQAFLKNYGLRIDYFLVCDKAKQKFLFGGVSKNVRSLQKTSDHAPIYAVFDV
ncbi:exodeoxyribonuclease III [Candidatus Gromoviella agglomerans]|uniref:exodeoxyribonuclease III n=1 Tax=Candidatus Gromoviella agglomerans TaxID=2806609 RepID=UPI001E3722D2|nr:exodeoxyribonuclease III [Candidatus Gromoviella agglomerans]